MDTETMEKDILDFDGDESMDIKIKPDYYIHLAIVGSQKTLMFSVMKGNSIGEGFTAYYIFIEHIEMLCKAAGYMDDSYDVKVKEYLESDIYKSESKMIQTAKLGNFKLNLLMTQLFGRTAKNFSIKV